MTWFWTALLTVVSMLILTVAVILAGAVLLSGYFNEDGDDFKQYLDD